jgi:adenosine deaminase
VSDWKTVPKVELHLHLEGAAPPDFIRRLGVEKNIDLTGLFDADGAYQYSGFAQFLAAYERACTVLQSPDDFRRLVRAVLAQSAAHNVIYTEIFIAPDFCGGGDAVAWDEFFSAMCEGAAEARAAHGIEARFISTCVRHFGSAKARVAATRSAEKAGDMLVGFGMGGNEGFGTAADYTSSFEQAAEAGLHLTTHAGEFDGPASVTRSLDHLRVARIGHGVRAVEDADLVHRLAAENITLEVNPGSNIALCVYPGWPQHPIDRLRAAGVPVTISTDDPPFFHTDMTHEYDMLQGVFGWGANDFRAVNEVALAAAFCDEKTKAKLLARLQGN